VSQSLSKPSRLQVAEGSPELMPERVLMDGCRGHSAMLIPRSVTAVREMTTSYLANRL